MTVTTPGLPPSQESGSAGSTAGREAILNDLDTVLDGLERVRVALKAEGLINEPPYKATFYHGRNRLRRLRDRVAER